MHKHFTGFNKPRKALSLQKIKKSDKENAVIPQIRTIKLLENHHTKLVVSIPAKTSTNQPQNDLHLLSDVKNKKPLTWYNRKPLKLRIQRQKSQQHIETSQNNEIATNVIAEVRHIVSHELVKELIENEVIFKRNHVGHIIINSEVFSGLLEKITSIFLNRKETETSALYPFLNNTLKKIRRLISMQNQQEKRQKNILVKGTQGLKVNCRLTEDHEALRYSMVSLHAQKKSLLTQIGSLQSMRFELTEQSNTKKKEIEQHQKSVYALASKIEDLSVEKQRMEEKIEKIGILLDTCQKQYEETVNYVDSQEKNKLIKTASQYYKEIEASIYEFAVYLQSNELANSYTYQSIPLQNQNYVLANLEVSMRDINRQLISNKEMSFEQKEKLMRDFVLHAYEEHKKKDQEFEKLLQFKTRKIRQFVDMMKKWLDNWTLKQEYLVGLKKEFVIDANTLCQKLKTIFCNKLCSSCCEANKLLYKQVVGIFEKIEENYKLGNSFY